MVKAKTKAWWERLTWPQVVALAVLVAGVLAIWIAVPADKLPPWEVVSGLVAIILGGSASSLLGPLVRRDDSLRERDTDPPSGGA